MLKLKSIYENGTEIEKAGYFYHYTDPDWRNYSVPSGEPNNGVGGCQLTAGKIEYLWNVTDLFSDNN